MKTRTFVLNKLVRDKIVESTEGQGGSVDYRVLDGEELTDALIQKLIEEARELLRQNRTSASEVADLQEIIDELCLRLHILKPELKREQNKKRAKNGSFKKGHFINKLTLPADNKWAKYYSSDPERFPEVN